jgi:tetratricopeptide (TPR) repeat protein
MYNAATRKFIDKVKTSLNLQVLVDEAADALLICCGGMTIVGLIFVLPGYRVELPYLIIPVVAALLYMVLSYRKKRYDVDQTAAYADAHFLLNDALVSGLDFENQPVIDGFHKLHFSTTEASLSVPDLKSLRLCSPWRKLVAGCVMGIMALSLIMQESSPAVVARQKLKQTTIEMTEDLNRDLRKELKDLEKRLSPAEKKLLEQTKLDKLVSDLKPRSEFKDAMRQYAKLEKAINKLSTSQQLKSNRQLLKEIARQLLKGRTNKKLGQHLSRGEYRQATEEIKKLKQAGDRQKNLEQLQKVLEKMKKAANQAASNDSKLKDKLSALKKAMDKYAKTLQSTGKEADNAAQEDLTRENQDAEKQLNNWNEALEQQQVTDEFIDKLMKMRGAMQKAQQKMRGMQKGQGPQGPAGMPVRGNGKKPGFGDGVGSDTARNRREATDEGSRRGKTVKITGQKGTGASRKNIEKASSGSALSKRVIKKTSNDFSYKMEEFIKRNDVPDEMKDGVKRYFNDLHEGMKATK